MGLFDKLMHLGEGRQVKRLEAIANQVNSIESEFEAMSDEELRGKIVGILQTPAARMVGVLQAPGGQVARVLAAYARQGDAA